MKKEIMNEDEITISDDEGNEVTFRIYFTYENEDRGAKYVIFFDEEDEENLYAYRYDDDGNLYEIEDQEEFDEVEEVINTFQADEADIDDD
ncbi:MAG: DUF1292 domain-containing protein [Coprobacillus sp.]|nr:DUF1292 domain-containing protein [Coprobacillus sp.]